MRRGAGAYDGEHVSVSFPTELLSELEREAKRLDRSLNWVVQRCLKRGLKKVRAMRGDAERGAA